ncbi:hypothetical protein GCM10027217_08520 [Pseudomaricurvus hydrocarbonicus]
MASPLVNMGSPAGYYGELRWLIRMAPLVNARPGRVMKGGAFEDQARRRESRVHTPRKMTWAVTRLAVTALG